MTTLFRSFIIGLFLTANLIQPAYMVGFDYQTFHNYIRLAQDGLESIKIQVQKNVDYQIEEVWTSEHYASYIRTLYRQQRKFLKTLLECLKDTKNNAFNKELEFELYKQWKHDFKRNYKNSLSTGNWSWSYDRFYFTIYE